MAHRSTDSDRRTHYEVLGLKSDCSQDDVKKAFVKLSKEHHPDMPGGCVEVSKRINVAYTVLSKTDDRRRYDAEIERNTWRPNPAPERSQRMATYDEVHKMYGFPSQANYNYAGRTAKSLLTAFAICMGIGLFSSFYLTHRDLTRPLERDGYGSIDSDNYLGGDIVARRAAREHRRVRDRTRAHGSFEEQLKFVESAVLKSSGGGNPEDKKE